MRPPTRLIDRVTIIDGELTAAVGELALPESAHQAALAAWIFLSEGIAARGHPEVVIAVARPDRQSDYPRFPFNLIHASYVGATTGTPAQAGSRISLSETGSPVAGAIFTRHGISDGRLRAVGVADGPRIPLLAIPLLADELMAADAFGHARVLARYGEHARHYPYPWWFDGRNSPILDLASDAEMSMLNRMPRRSARFLEVVLRSSDLEILVPDDKCGELSEILASAPRAAALLPRFSGMADSVLVWHAGQALPSTIFPAGGTQAVLKIDYELSIGGNFLVLLRGHERPEAVFLEDGFALLFPDSVWERFVASAGACRPMRWETHGPMIREASLRITSNRMWVPLHGYLVSERGFREHQPRTRKPGPLALLRNVDVERVLLLVAEYELEEAGASDAVVRVTEEVCAILDDGLDGVLAVWEQLVVDVRLAWADPVHIVLDVREKESIPQPELRRLEDRLNRIPAPAVDHDELRFQIWLRPRVS